MPDFATPTPQGLIDLAWASLLHSAWLGVLAGSLASSLVALGRPASPRARHAAIVATLLLAAIAAPAAALAQRSLARRDVSSPFVVATPREAGPMRAASGRPATPGAVSPPVPATASTWGVRVRGAIAAAASRLHAMRPYLLAAWATAASASAAALALGAASLRRLRREAAPSPALDRRARALGRMLRLRRTPPVREHPCIAEPCLAGALRPMVLIPSRWSATAPADQVVAVLAHELAHARRLDHRTNVLLRAIEAASGFHPGVRRAARLARREAERAADALAVRLTGDPSALARALESVARSSPPRPRPLRPGLAVGGDRPSLLPRVQELLGMKPARPRFPLRVVASIPFASGLAWLAISSSPAQEPGGATTTSASPVVTPPAIGTALEPDDPAEAEWLAKVREFRARVVAPESDEYAMGVLLRLVPGNPRMRRPALRAPQPAELAPGDVPDDVLLRLAAKRPWRLDPEDLVTLVRTIPHGAGDAAKLSREELLRVADPNQVCFEVRFLQVRHDPAKAPADVPQGGSKLASVVPAYAIDRLIAASRSQFPIASLQAPKVTTFEGAAATIAMDDDPAAGAEPGTRAARGVDRASDVRLAARLDGPPPKADDRMLLTDRLHGRLEVRLAGIRKSWGHAVEVRLLGSLPADAGAPGAAAVDVERLARFNVWEGDGVLVDVGIDAYATGDAPPGPHVRTLVAITPRHIPNEQEQEAMQGPVADFPASPTAAR